MFSLSPLRKLTVAVVVTILMIPALAGAATTKKKTSSSKSSSSKTTSSKSTASSESTAKTPPQKIDISKLETVPSLYNRELAKPMATAPSSSLFGFLSSGYRYDSRMIQAANIASSRAYAHSRGSCWRYVKSALMDAGVIDSRPKTAYAKEAAWELPMEYGFTKISCSDPYKAPVGSLLVYGGRGAGHIEFRTTTGFVSDFRNAKPSSRPLIGVFVKR